MEGTVNRISSLATANAKAHIFYRHLQTDLGVHAMKSAVTNVCKASLTLLFGWAFAGWLLFLLIASFGLIS